MVRTKPEAHQLATMLLDAGVDYEAKVLSGMAGVSYVFYVREINERALRELATKVVAPLRTLQVIDLRKES